ncbi:DUF5777 family beta-barrel protein [Emticicia sp. 21SJ11W-3]|uniref:DUF5777 family beta-barrel protein n=1 Tax=Emticicia sp. 21SJ11W-3 TaxID=2916755 RepID=UPI00209D7013|nr:DUF5777 family beta-barrel protein [Emticicia sp. 21SJ11W-3]UTA66828.1 DUF5777 family beta-barrel protein [Emticicia sp. 21SJ11W-3]
MKTMLKRTLLIAALLGARQMAAAQDLLNELDKTVPLAKTYTTATFKSTRVINGHSVETVAKKHLDFRISHRFGRLNEGAYNLYGLDAATMRIGLEYGLTDRLMIGVGRSTSQKTYDFFAKYRAVRQSPSGSPVSITALAAADAITLSTSPNLTFYNNQQRFTYVGQLLIARKFNEKLSLQLSPTYLHSNRIEASSEPNDILAMGIGGRMKISKRTSINAEYFYRLPLTTGTFNLQNSVYHNSLSVGFDIETGGHVFQLHFTNSLGMIERQFIAQTDGMWNKGDIHYGFNISRTFSFDKKR